jgi:heavy metal translocating P-type ATPase
MTIDSQTSVCSLCGLSLPVHSIVEVPFSFCCRGCQAVFSILSTKNQLGNFKDHPIFKQAIHAGLISNPELLEQIHRNQSAMESCEKEKIYFEIQDMWCPSCAEVIKLLLLQEKGVFSCIVDYATDLAAIEFSPRYISKERIKQIIMQFGYTPVALDDQKHQRVSGGLYLRFIVAAFFALNIMMFAYPLYATYFSYDDQGIGPLFAWLSLFASLPVLMFSAWPIIRRFYYSLKTGLFGMEVLVVLGVSSAFGLSVYELLSGGVKVYFDSMAVIIAFVLLGKIIETKAKFSAKDSLVRLSRSLPKRGRKQFEDGRQEFVPLKEIRQGDLLIVLTGEKVVLDGVVNEGEGACDESLINGEAMPVLKIKGSFVLGGTLVKQGRLCYQVTSTKEESSLQRIISMVEQEIGHKTHYVRAVDHIVRWFVPLVILIAFFAAFSVWFLTDDFQRAIIQGVSVLLISCPCAIGIAAPLAESHLLNALAKLGVIVRNRGCLSHLGNETVFVFDKTGTITEGKFKVLRGLESLNNKQLAILKGLSGGSIHPLAVAIYQAIDIAPAKLTKVEEFAGKGIKGSEEGEIFYLGSASFLKEAGIKALVEEGPPQEEGIVTTVYFNEFPIDLGDKIRKDAKKALAELYPAKTVLLSGDSRLAVEAVAKYCEFQHYQWGASPLQKKIFLEELRSQNQIVCMLGDGINDAPALAAAHVAISVVSATDISIQVSDILLTTDRLDVLAQMRELGRKGRNIIKQNLFWAFFYNVVGIAMAAAGFLSPLFAAFAMVASSLMVILNAQRLEG